MSISSVEDATTGYQTAQCHKEHYHNMNTTANDMFHLLALTTVPNRCTLTTAAVHA